MPHFNKEQIKVIVALIYLQFGTKQELLGQCFGNVSRSTICSWIKEGKYLIELAEYQKKLSELRCIATAYYQLIDQRM